MIKDKIKPLYFILRSSILKSIPKPSRKVIPSGKDLRILVIRLDRVGDMALSTPIFRLLRKAFPQAVISVLVNENIADLVRNNPNINNIFYYKGFLKTVLEHRNKYDIVIDMINLYVLRTALLTRLLNAPFTIGYDVKDRGRLFTDAVPVSTEKKHFINFIPDLLKPLAIKISDDLSPEIFPGSKEKLTALGFLSKNGVNPGNFLIAAHPGAFYLSNRWPEKYFISLFESIFSFNSNVKILILGSSGEKELVNRIFNSLSENSRNKTILHAENGLGMTMALLSCSKLFIGNNSGLLHLATALKIPTVSFMGPPVPWMWRSWGSDDTNIVFRKDLPCSPCNKGVCEDHTCMNSILPEEVLNKIKPLLK